MSVKASRFEDLRDGCGNPFAYSRDISQSALRGDLGNTPRVQT
jgi:hypothetical protein